MAAMAIASIGLAIDELQRELAHVSRGILDHISQSSLWKLANALMPANLMSIDVTKVVLKETEEGTLPINDMHLMRIQARSDQ